MLYLSFKCKLQPHEVPESYKRNSREKSVTASEEGTGEKKPESDSDEDVPLVKVKEERVTVHSNLFIKKIN